MLLRFPLGDKYLMRIDELFESVHPAVLYHCTAADSAGKIIYTNTILDNTDHNVRLPYGKTRTGFRPTDINKYDNVKGVSLSRNPFFARRWGSGEGVVLVLDGEKLRQNYRIVPFDYYKNRAEAEEFLVGPLKNVNRYLKSIVMSQKTFDELQEYDDQFIEGHKPYEDILTHPLLKIEGHSWHNMTGKIQATATA